MRELNALFLIVCVLVSMVGMVSADASYYDTVAADAYTWTYSAPQGCTCVESGVSLTDCDLFKCTCACDVTAGKCDYNCCCDPDCSSDQISRFRSLGVCSAERHEEDSLTYCYSDLELSSINHRATIKDAQSVSAALSDALCIEAKNYNYEGEFYDNTAATTSSIFATSSGQKEFNYDESLVELTADNYYDQNDTITAYLAVGTDLFYASDGSWPIPVADFSGACNDQNFAKFENEIPGPFSSAYSVGDSMHIDIASKEKVASCARTFPSNETEFKNQCSATSVSRYVTDLYIQKTASLSSFISLTTSSSNVVQVSLSGAMFLDPISGEMYNVTAAMNANSCDPSIIDYSTGHDITSDACAFQNANYNFGYPDYGINGVNYTICSNMVKSVRYVVRHDADAEAAITSVNAYVVLTDLFWNSEETSVQQSFMLTFADTTAETTSKSDGNLMRRTRSGNPGYIMGAPLLWAVANADTTIVDETSEGFKLPSALPLSSQQVAGSTGSRGMCVTTADADVGHVQVPFGYDLTSGCTVELTRSELQDMCCVANTNCASGAYASDFVRSTDGLPAFFVQTLQDAYVGIYGSADPLDIGQWLEVEMPDIPSRGGWVASTSTCEGLVAGVHYEFLVSRTGEKAFPQNKIIAAQATFVTRDWAFRKGVHDSTATQTFAMTSTASFVFKDDVALKGYTPPPPPIIFRIPYDAFYPFDIGNAAPASSQSSMAAIVSTLLVTLMLAIGMR